MDQLPPHVVIDLKSIYDQIVILSTRVELLMSKQLDHDRHHTDYEGRLRSLERARWPLPSLAVLVSLGALALAVLR